MKLIKLFFVKIRYFFFVIIVEWEIYHRIFPHILGNRKCVYPFNSDHELLKVTVQSKIDVENFIKAVGNRAAKMDKSYGEAFQFIMYRDLNERMEMFDRLISQRTYPPLWNPRYFIT